MPKKSIRTTYQLLKNDKFFTTATKTIPTDPIVEDSIQMNPQSAMYRSHERSVMEKVLASASVLGLLIAGVMLGSAVTRTQKVVTQASIDLKHSFQATVLSVNNVSGEFTVQYDASFGQRMPSSQRTVWNVSLPYERDELTRPSGICFDISSVEGDFSKKIDIACTTLLRESTKVIIEYSVIDDQKGWLVAKTIYGEGR